MEQKKSKKGTVPLSEKSEVKYEFGSSASTLDIDPSLKAELKKEGLTYRWINKKQYEASGNTHRSYWQAYKRQNSEGKEATEFKFGTSPEGYIVRGDMVLAVRSLEVKAAHRKHLDSKNAALMGIQKQKARELKEMVGNMASVDDGYDESEAE